MGLTTKEQQLRDLAKKLLKAHGDLIHKRIDETAHSMQNDQVLKEARGLNIMPNEVLNYAMSNQDALIASLEKDHHPVPYKPPTMWVQDKGFVR